MVQPYDTNAVQLPDPGEMPMDPPERPVHDPVLPPETIPAGPVTEPPILPIPAPITV